MIDLARGNEKININKYPILVEVIDLALAICLFFLSESGVASIAKGLTVVESIRDVVPANRVPLLAANSSPFFKGFEFQNPLNEIFRLFV